MNNRLEETVWVKFQMAYDECPYVIGRMMVAVLAEIKERGLLTLEVFQYLCSHQATLDFKLHGWKLIIPADGENGTLERRVADRYYKDCVLEFDGKSYLISSQLVAQSYLALIEWVSRFGWSKDEVLQICENRNVRRKLTRSKGKK